MYLLLKELSSLAQDTIIAFAILIKVSSSLFPNLRRFGFFLTHNYIGCEQRC